MRPSTDFYEFVDPNFGRAKICIGPNQAACSIFTERSFVRMFGGYCLYRDKESGQKYIGTWRKRSAAKFRRLMREGGVALQLRKEMPETLIAGANGARARST